DVAEQVHLIGPTAEKTISCEIDSTATKKRAVGAASTTGSAGMNISVMPMIVAGATSSGSPAPRCSGRAAPGR
ncbi:MAG TPA: hypothetical protein VKM69_05160, partial [Natronoarchaeum rubrum]|nr:hypothetical protein [Natronoarchaeum rubrum]